MRKAKEVIVKESMEELKSMKRKSSRLIIPRLDMLIKLKKHNGRLSRLKLAAMLKVSDKSVKTRREKYIKGGIEALIARKEKKGRVSKIFGPEERSFLEETFNNPKNGIQGYAELMKIMNDRFKKTFNYSTLRDYCIRNYGTKIKVARKSHVKKDEEKVADFKKTSLQTSNRFVKA